MKPAILCCLLAVIACGKKKSQEATEPAGSAVGTVIPAGSAPPPAMPDAAVAVGSAATPGGEVEIPTEVDFEAEATTKITDTNVDTELQALEKDLAP